MSELKTLDKAFAYITRGDEILVFLQPDFPEIGLQVPGGTVEQGSSRPRRCCERYTRRPDSAHFSESVFLGEREFDARPYGKPEIHRRHFFHLVAPGLPQDRYQHFELHSRLQRPVAFDLFWLPLEEASRRLAYSSARCSTCCRSGSTSRLRVGNLSS